MTASRLLLLGLSGLLTLVPPAARGDEGTGAAGAAAGARQVQPASGEAEAAIRQFRVPAGFKVELFAAEPHVANISAFDIAPDGKAYVAEVFRRRGGGVLDMRNLPAWLEDDLASRTVADRIALVKRRLSPQDQRAMQVESDRVRLVEDRDGDGRADHASVFADRFNKLEDGTAAGVLAFNGGVYFADIPNLWLLRDQDGDGRADARKLLHTGFGVRYNISGHDLHGLRMGPDGRLYFSIGDRALHVTGPDGKVIVSNPDSGAVLRCEPDGSSLELVHTGLRNPQDLAFDEFGNLFTGDNNSDGGDASRWVYVVEGGDSGWRVGYQWHDFPISRGPWNNERLWDVKSNIPAAYVLPPIANPDVAGPSGLTYTGGVGLPPEWRNRFLLVDFRGGATNSGVWALQNRPRGASFELAEIKKLVRGTLATDVECGYDGGVYFSDWVTGWVPMGKGRIYRVTHEGARQDPSVADARHVMAAGVSALATGELVRLLGHDDMRVRTAAQFALAERHAARELCEVARSDSRRLARLHGIWGLRRATLTPADWSAVFPALLKDPDDEVRAQAAKVVGERREGFSARYLTPLFRDPSDRVRFFAAIAAGRLEADYTKEAFDLLRQNNGRDPYLRHAAVMALVGGTKEGALVEAADDASLEVRLGALLTLRRLGSPRVARYLADRDARVVLEAARAINDAPIDGATPDFAAVITRTAGIGDGKVRELILMRALNANFRLGASDAAARVAAFARRDDVPEFLRVEALKMLGDWGKAATRDRVTGVYHPVAAREQAVANAAIRPLLPEILRTAPDRVRAAAAGLVQTVGITDTAVLFDLVKGPRFSGEARAAALAALAEQKSPHLPAAVDIALRDKDRALRRAAMRAAATLPDGPARLRGFIDSGPVADQQAAFQALAGLPDKEADSILADSMDRLVAGKVPPEARLDLLTAAEARRTAPAISNRLQRYRSALPKDDALAEFRDTLAGGDVHLGRKIFMERADVQCLRCHAIKGEGGAAGPDLAGIGKRQTREYLLESMLFPAKHIAQGWETVTVRLKNGDTLAGVLKSEDERQLVLADPEKGDVKIEKAAVQARRGGQTAMPTDIAQPLSKHDLRNLVEFLASLK